jgi:hypothetical protein
VGQNGQDTVLVLASDSETMELILPEFPGF